MQLISHETDLSWGKALSKNNRSKSLPQSESLSFVCHQTSSVKAVGTEILQNIHYTIHITTCLNACNITHNNVKCTTLIFNKQNYALT